MNDLIEVDLDKMYPVVRDFINDSLARCRQNNIRIHLPRAVRVSNKGTYCAGYFDDDPLEFAVACGRNTKKWLSTFVHESCHLDQWLENTELWNGRINGAEPIAVLDNWLQGQIELEDNTKKQLFDRIISVELDCEKRSVEKIRKFKLPINTDRYIRESNAYVWSYRLVEETRDWDHSAAYECESVWRAMPNHFDNDYSYLSDEIRDILMSHATIID